MLNILVGGVDTSQSQLAHALRLLAERPEQWAALRADPETLALRAVEEALRYEPITPFTARLLTEDVELRGVDFPAGTVVSVCAFTAQPRPRGVRRARRVRHHRSSARRPARSPSAPASTTASARNLARAEIAEALAFLAGRIETLEPAGEPSCRASAGSTASRRCRSVRAGLTGTTTELRAGAPDHRVDGDAAVRAGDQRVELEQLEAGVEQQLAGPGGRRGDRRRGRPARGRGRRSAAPRRAASASAPLDPLRRSPAAG